MDEPIEGEIPEPLEPLDIANLNPIDIPLETEFGKPDASASKTKRGLFGSKKEPKQERTPPPRSRPRAPAKKRGALVQPLTQLYTSVGALMIPFDPTCGSAIIANAENCARTLDDLAYQNDAVRRALTALVQTSVWGGVIAAHTPILLAIAIHHVPSVQTAMGAMGEQFANQVAANMPPHTPPAEG